MSWFLCFDPAYTLDFREHVFPVQKYRMIAEALVAKKIIRQDQLISPEPASDDDILLAHSREYLARLKHYAEQDPISASRELEAPCYQTTLDAKNLMTGGTIRVTREALRQGGACAGVNIGGGFHHAESQRGGGFCFINDIAVSVRVVQREGLCKRALVVDTDVHQGNGTAEIFRDDPSVCILDIHQADIYPAKQPAEMNIGLDDGCGDDEYLERLGTGLEEVIERHGAFDMIHYVAGADPWHQDKLGGLKLTMGGFQGRDRLLIGLAKHLDVPIMVSLAGGYAQRTEDTAAIHAQMVGEMVTAFG